MMKVSRMMKRRMSPRLDLIIIFDSEAMFSCMHNSYLLLLILLRVNYFKLIIYNVRDALLPQELTAHARLQALGAKKRC